MQQLINRTEKKHIRKKKPLSSLFFPSYKDKTECKYPLPSRVSRSQLILMLTEATNT